MEPAYSVLRDQEQDADLAALASQYARMLGFVDRLEESIEPLERAIEIAEQLREWGTLSHALNTKGLVSLSTGRPQEGRTLLLGALRVAEEANDHQTALRAHFNLSYVAQGVGPSARRRRSTRPGAVPEDWRPQLGAGVPDAPGGRPVPERRLGRGAEGG